MTPPTCSTARNPAVEASLKQDLALIRSETPVLLSEADSEAELRSNAALAAEPSATPVREVRVYMCTWCDLFGTYVCPLADVGA